MNAATAIFIVLAAIAVVSALNVVFRRNPVHSAIFLAFTIVALAGIFLLFNAEFIAAIEVIIYAGAIIVLFLFTMMLLDVRGAMGVSQLQGQFRVAFPVAALLLAALVAVAVGTVAVTGLPASSISEAQAAQIGSVQNLGQALYSDFLLPFEVASLILTVGLIGAISLAGKGPEDEEEQERIRGAEAFDAEMRAEQQERGKLSFDDEDAVTAGHH